MFIYSCIYLWWERPESDRGTPWQYWYNGLFVFRFLIQWPQPFTRTMAPQSQQQSVNQSSKQINRASIAKWYSLSKVPCNATDDSRTLSVNNSQNFRTCQCWENLLLSTLILYAINKLSWKSKNKYVKGYNIGYNVYSFHARGPRQDQCWSKMYKHFYLRYTLIVKAWPWDYIIQN